jgi:hypothetical protein
MYLCTYVLVSMCVCKHVCVHVCVHACAHAYSVNVVNKGRLCEYS